MPQASLQKKLLPYYLLDIISGQYYAVWRDMSEHVARITNEQLRTRCHRLQWELLICHDCGSTEGVILSNGEALCGRCLDRQEMQGMGA